MNTAEQLVREGLEREQDLPGFEMTQAERTEKWRRALENVRHIRQLRSRQHELEGDLEFAMAYEHALSEAGIARKDVDRVVRRSQHTPGQALRTLQARLKLKGDSRWNKAQDSDIVGVDMNDGQRVMFKEWIACNSHWKVK